MYKFYDQKQRAHGRIPLAGTETMRLHEGLGTATKPSHEPIAVARKPLSEAGVARNVLKHSYRSEDGRRYILGTGAINVDGCRVGNARGVPVSLSKNKTPNGIFNEYGGGAEKELNPNQGRWPPNLLLSHHPDCKPTGEVRRVKPGNGGGYVTKDSTKGMFGVHSGKGHVDPDGTEPQEVWECVAGCPVRLLDEQSGQIKDRNSKKGVYREDIGYHGNGSPSAHPGYHKDQGGASRFFPRFEGEAQAKPEAPFRYVAKASRAERNKGLEGMPEVTVDDGRKTSIDNPFLLEETGRTNSHPTVKPIMLMRWLVRLVTPPGGVVLDPFAGSGSTGCAAVQEGFNFIGIEQDESYAEIARRRIAYWSGRTPAATTEVAEAPDPTDPTFTGRLF